MASPMVERKGRVFRFGSHVDGKGNAFSLTRAEYEIANPPGTVVPVDFDPVGKGHWRGENDFQGELGSAELSADDRHALGRFAIHPLLDKVIARKGHGMSAIFAVPSKQILRIDVTDRPVLDDARFFAVDGSVAEVGFAVELLPKGESGFALGEDREDEEKQDEDDDDDLAQHMHECLAAGYPSLCDADGMTGLPPSKRPAHLIALHDLTVHHGALCPGMSLSRSNATFAREDYPMAETVSDDEIQATDAFDRAEFAEMKRQLKEERELRIAGQAVAFAKDHASVLPPSSQPLAVGLYAALADVGAAGGTVEFGYGKDNATRFKGSPLDLFRVFVGQLRPHGLGVERMLNGHRDSPVVAPAPIAGVYTFAGEEPAADPSKLTDADKARLDKLLKDNG